MLLILVDLEHLAKDLQVEMQISCHPLDLQQGEVEVLQPLGVTKTMLLQELVERVH